MSEGTGPAVRLVVEGDVLRATIDRPSTRNAIDSNVLAGLEEMVEVARDEAVKVVVLRGGDGTFCSGADLNLLRSWRGDTVALRSFMSRLGRVLEELERAPWVNLAVIEGYAVAGGCELLLACDIVVSSTEARIGDRHAEYGLVPAAGGSVRLPRAIPPLLARYLLLTGEMISGTEAVEMGLATLAVAPAKLDQEVDRIVERLRTRGYATLATVKAMLADDRAAEMSPRLSRELDLFVSHFESAADPRIGLDAFRDGVKPAFAADRHDR